MVLIDTQASKVVRKQKINFSFLVVEEVVYSLACCSQQNYRGVTNMQMFIHALKKKKKKGYVLLM